MIAWKVFAFGTRVRITLTWPAAGQAVSRVVDVLVEVGVVVGTPDVEVVDEATVEDVLVELLVLVDVLVTVDVLVRDVLVTVVVCEVLVEDVVLVVRDVLVEEEVVVDDVLLVVRDVLVELLLVLLAVEVLVDDVLLVVREVLVELLLVLLAVEVLVDDVLLVVREVLVELVEVLVELLLVLLAVDVLVDVLLLDVVVLDVLVDDEVLDEVVVVRSQRQLVHGLRQSAPPGEPGSQVSPQSASMTPLPHRCAQPGMLDDELLLVEVLVDELVLELDDEVVVRLVEVDSSAVEVVVCVVLVDDVLVVVEDGGMPVIPTLTRRPRCTLSATKRPLRFTSFFTRRLASGAHRSSPTWSSRERSTGPACTKSATSDADTAGEAGAKTTDVPKSIPFFT